MVPATAVLMAAFHVPAIAGMLVELVGNTGGTAFRHKGPMAVKVGTVCGVTVTIIWSEVAGQGPAGSVLVRVNVTEPLAIEGV